ncbi:hypothetical protein RRG08_010526 [Elysia crispata]|uniref:Uncharacterized protein n=1 Tax=Elysia crispata TaxID=231223 RepID=A0AAE1APT2_9GAST|nr:hypothetical protein RRG08_010526 [Elysia crispata]
MPQFPVGSENRESWRGVTADTCPSSYEAVDKRKARMRSWWRRGDNSIVSPSLISGSLGGVLQLDEAHRTAT